MYWYTRSTVVSALPALGVLLLLTICQLSPLRAAEPAGPDSTGSDAVGKRLYHAKCAACHGAQGEGSDEYDQRLEGGLSIAQLADVIQETMPADDPGTLSPEQAQAVAAHVHDTFYSAIARERNRPARIELARLTVKQQRRAMTDLIASFRGSARLDTTRGLQAEYYRGRRLGGRRDRVASRVDAEVDFDFGTAAPLAEITDASQFSIRWQGALIVPETGHYEFQVHTENAARLWVNDTRQPLIDAWVMSGDDTDFTANLFLVGGTVYPLRLEYTKAKQGVDDSAKQKKKTEKPASISLRWKTPHGVLEPIASRYLSPQSGPEQFVSGTPFPPDDRSFGWERGTAVSKEWEQATTSAAFEMAGYVVANLNSLAGTKDGDPKRAEKARAFCERFAERAFRRPLDEPQRALYIDRQFASGPVDASVKRVVMLVLKSPRFLFREVQPGSDAYDVAARLAFGLWDSIPDQALRQAARENRLATREQVTEQAARMVQDLRGKSKLRDFLLTWLKMDLERDLGKDADQFAGYDAAVMADLRTSLELFLDDVLDSPDADFRRLLLSEDVYLNDRLAPLYRGQPAEQSAFAGVRLDDGRRAGVLTHPYLMASFANNKQSSPIHRGVLLARGILGVYLKAPPAAVAPLAPDLHPNLTTRQRVEMQTKPAECQTCHSIINPLGFTLEHFDAVGCYRDQDHGQPVDATGSYRTRTGEDVTFHGARELASFLAASEEVHSAFAEQLFHHLVQQPVRAYGPATLDQLRESFEAQDYNILQLAVDVMAVSALVGRGT